MQISSPIVPAIIPRSYEDLVTQIQKIAGIPEVHVDVVDGIFVPSVSWPYHDRSDVAVAHDLLARFSLEVDLMVSDPLPAARAWLIAGADQLVFHIETISPEAFIAFTEQTAVTVGVALGSGTSLSQLYPYLAGADYVQLMGIATIGSQGQPFDESVLERISILKNEFPHLPLSIDGSVNATTLQRLSPLGLSRFIVGSAIMGDVAPAQAYATLTQSLEN